MIVLGADPGIDGAIAAIRHDGNVVLCEVVPTLPTGKGSRRDYDMDAIRGILEGVISLDSDLLCAVERQHAFPSTFGKRQRFCQCGADLICVECGADVFRCHSCGRDIPKPSGMKGSIANFKQGSGMRLWTDAFYWNGISGNAIVDPRTWQSYFGIKGKRQGKEAPSIAVVQKLFPTVDLRRSSRAKIPHSGKADALLIAEWCRLMNSEDF